ncbi:unnamed protein product [Dovyalis caffra]|uniref:Uncharacterized protein n=1 Tax=Dovyalis caffra TaxID=77055 RepID=A0AAV1R1V2_9ROSI|nr:unnamed protein product [Dovyalis caffra]
MIAGDPLRIFTLEYVVFEGQDMVEANQKGMVIGNGKKEGRKVGVLLWQRKDFWVAEMALSRFILAKPVLHFHTRGIPKSTRWVSSSSSSSSNGGTQKFSHVKGVEGEKENE